MWQPVRFCLAGVLFGAILFLFASPSGASDSEISALEKALARPTATGLLVTRVVPGSQADRQGIEAGDILVAYAGVPIPIPEAMSRAKEEAEGKDSVEVKWIRDGWTRTVLLEPGQIGVQLMPVIKGVRRQTLPPETVSTFDFSAFGEKGQDDWYYFLREGARAGVGRIQVRRLGDSLFVHSEEVIDTGSELNDHEVLSATDTSVSLVPVMSVFRDRMNDWVRYGLPMTGATGCAIWNSTTTGPGSEEKTAVRKYHGRAVPVYMVETLVALMPRVKDACFRFLPLYEGSGEVGLESALVGIGEEKVAIGAAEHTGFKFEWRRLDGQTISAFWVDGDGRLFLADYGGIRAVHAEKAEAMKDQPEGVRARLSR
jgi:hypothetical protein